MAVNQKLVDEVVEFIGQTPEWIKCSERMPEYGPVYFAVNGPQDSTIFAGSVCQIYWRSERGSAAYPRSDRSITHWMPRYVPAPPVEEESACVKELRNQRCSGLTAEELIDQVVTIVKRHEKAGK